MSVPNLNKMKSISKEDAHTHIIEYMEMWYEARIRDGIRKYCEACNVSESAVSEFFFGEVDKVAVEKRICCGRYNNGKGNRCNRTAKPGTNYCGYHQGQVRAPKRTFPVSAIEEVVINPNVSADDVIF